MSEITKNTGENPAERPLYLAVELGNSEWKPSFSPGLGQAARQRKIQAGDLVGLEAEIRRAKERFKLAETTRMVSCYEAVRDGFWLHRYLVSRGVDNRVVDSASIKVNRRAKRAKTDSLDVQKLLTVLIRADNGEEKVWSVVHVPSVEAEDSRHLHRQLSAFKADRTRHSNRIKGMFVGQGVRLPVEADFLAGLSKYCGSGAQIANCSVALSGLWRNARRRSTQTGLTWTLSRT